MWWLKNVQVVDPSQELSGVRDVLVADGKIEGMAPSFSEEEIIERSNGQDVKTIEGKGRYLFPGLIDVHTHLREPGQEDKEDVLSGSRAAVRGGFTSILAMANTFPVIDQRALVEFVHNQGQRAGYARVYPVGAVSKGMRGEELVEMVDLAEGGAAAFSDDGKGIANSELMRLALEYAKLTKRLIISHCEDSDLQGKGFMHKGEASARLGLRGIPSSAETVMLARDLLLAAETGGRLHVAHLSTREGVEMVRAAKVRGVDVSAEVNPHHLIFTDEDITLTNTSLKVNPPLRSRADREALLEGLADGTIDMLATDHAPHTWEEKARPFAEAPFGIIGLETALAALWQHVVKPGRIKIERIIEAWSTLPARRFGLPGGSLQPGQSADMVLFDPEVRELIRVEDLRSKAQNTPFLGQELEGFAVMTWVEGKLVFSR